MGYRINHIHLKSPDPRKTAEWYVKAFDFQIASDETRVFGDRFVRCKSADGGINVNISGARTDEKLGPGNALPHHGLEHSASTPPTSRPTSPGSPGSALDSSKVRRRCRTGRASRSCKGPTTLGSSWWMRARSRAARVAEAFHAYCCGQSSVFNACLAPRVRLTLRRANPKVHRAAKSILQCLTRRGELRVNTGATWVPPGILGSPDDAASRKSLLVPRTAVFTLLKQR